MQPDGAAAGDPSDSEQPREQVGQVDPALLDENGAEFPSESVYLYALRHSYAQRHADAGVPLDTLQKLMDHRTAATTQIYYRVTWARKREAIERLAPLTMDKSGRRVGFHASLVESERLREEIGRFPSARVLHRAAQRQALGAHCPFSHQCLGCEHFRTDPSHLPDLYAYLDRLLETRERLRAAVPQLAEWARAKAIPAVAEIRTVRALIGAGEGALDELAPGERSKLLELFRVLRATRAQMDGTIGIEHIGATSTRSPRSRHHAHAAASGAIDLGRDEHGMSDRAASMNTARRRINSEKRERVQAVIVQIKDQGREDHPRRRSSPAVREFTGRSEQPLRRADRARPGGDPVALHRRAERPDGGERRVAQGRDGNRQAPSPRSARKEIRSLKARLARALGEEVAAEHPEHSLASAAVTDLRAQVEQLVGELGESRGRLRDTEEELEAARRLNRTLIRERNATASRS